MGIFVSLEGIDACGKSTTVQAVYKMLLNESINAALIDRKTTEYNSAYLRWFMSKFKDLLWGAKKDTPVTEISDNGWLFMHALWYDIMSDNIIKPSKDNYDIILIDGWFYKIYSRFNLKKAFDHSITEKVFSKLIRCDNVFILDTKPEICWERRSSFKPSELGYHDYYKGDERQRFIEYQDKVRNELIHLSKKHDGWSIINTGDLSVNEIALNISKLLIHNLEQGKALI